jgi:hypothetical protein
MADAGQTPLGWYATNGAENTFPALPVRHESVLVSIAAVTGPFVDLPDHPAFEGLRAAPTQEIVGVPTGRSELR